MAGQRWRQRAAYAAVMVGGIASLATSLGDDQKVKLQGTLTLVKDTATSQRFRVRTTARWTIAAAKISPGNRAAFRMALVPDDPSLFETSGSAQETSGTFTSPKTIALGQPPCAVSLHGCGQGSTPGAEEYGFELVIDQISADGTVDYEVTVSTDDPNTRSDDFGLELVKD